MKVSATLLLTALLATGCASFPGSNGKDATTGAAATEEKSTVRERNGNWRVDCVNEEASRLTHCKAETYSKVTGYSDDEARHPTPILWISWLKGDPKHIRSACVFGYNYPVTGVSLQVDANPPLQIGALNVPGCLTADATLIKQLRAGQALKATFQRWPWGQTIVTFSLHNSTNALDELDRLVEAQ